MANLRPISERVLIKQLKAENKIKSGIIHQEGILLAVGKEVKNTLLKVGDQVLWQKDSGTKLNYPEDRYTSNNKIN